MEPAITTQTGRDAHGRWLELDLAGVPARMRWCPPGRFHMGSPIHEVGRGVFELPLTQVTRARGFWLSEGPVTWALWRAVMRSRSGGEGDRPAEGISWDDTQIFFRHRLARPELRLPREVEWEYACRAGTSGAMWLGDEASVRAEVAWFADNSGGQAQPVGARRPNPWGLHDMLGNVRAWCDDLWQYPPGVHGGEISAHHRVIRGACWASPIHQVRAAHRTWAWPGNRMPGVGFRWVLDDGADLQAGVSHESLPVNDTQLPLTIVRGRGTGAAVLVLPSAFGIGPDLVAQLEALAEASSLVVTFDPFFRTDPGRVPYDDMPRIFARLRGLDRAQHQQDIEAVLAWMRQEASVPVVGVGVCFGAPFVLAAAADGHLAGVVTWHGSRMEAHLARAGEIHCPLRLHFGALDPVVPPAAVEAVRAAFAGHADCAVVVHPGATHGFSHRAAPAFDGAAEAAGMAAVLELVG